jgi:predicted O-methyltransferase YrrM
VSEAPLEAIRDVEGWLSPAQAQVLFGAAEALPDGAVAVEIGSFQGRSTIMLARGLEGRGRVVAIDPHAGNDRGPQEIEGMEPEAEADHERFKANLAHAGVADRVTHVRLPSQEALGAVDDAVDLLFVDGAHRFGPARADIERWGERVRPGGVMLVHDSFSSVGVTLAILRSLAFAGRFRFEGRTGSLARYRRVKLRGPERARNAGRQLAQLPWFARNLGIKLAVVLRLRRDLTWPY